MAISFVTFGGANTTNINTTLTCQVGDLIIEGSWAASTTPPTLGTGMQADLGTVINTPSVLSGRFGYKIATTTSWVGSSSTWTNGAVTFAVIYRGTGTPLSVVGLTGSSTTVGFAAATLSTLGGTSWFYRAGWHAAQAISTKNVTGYTIRDTTTNGNHNGEDSNGGLSANPTADSLTAGTTGGWMSVGIEIPVPAVATTTNLFFPLF